MSKVKLVLVKDKEGSVGTKRVPLIPSTFVGDVPRSFPEAPATRHPFPCVRHMAPSGAVSSHERLFTSPPASFSPCFEMARPPLSSALNRLSLGDLGSPPSCPGLLIPFSSGTMQNIMAAIAALNRTMVDIKLSVRNTYNAVCTSVDQHEEMAKDLSYAVNQLSCRDSRIDDLEKNLFELMGKVDNLQEHIAVLTGKTQGSCVQDNLTVNQEIKQEKKDAASAYFKSYG